jgi:pimeloyl-ACP methyl ester carboxylesterase
MRRSLKIIGVVFALVIVVLGVGVAASWAPDRPVETLLPRWAPPPSQFLQLDGMRVHYRDEGPRTDPTPIVLVHGTSSSLHTWQGWADALSPTRRVIRMDLPGFGLTGPSPANDYSMPAYVRFIEHFLDRLAVTHCVLGGNSLGGNIAWRVAVADPRVVKLVLVDSGGYPLAPRSMPLGFRLAQTKWLRPLTNHLLPRGVIAASLRDVYGDPNRVTPDVVDRYYELTLRAGNRAALARRFEQRAEGADATKIRDVKVPTLVMWGGRDRLVPPENAAAFHRDIAGSRVVVYPKLGHVPQEEDPARTIPDLRAFLDEHDGT